MITAQPTRRARLAGCLLTSAVASTLALCCSAPSVYGQAPGAFEPNENIDQTYGPLQPNVDYRATIETTNDADWYRVSLGGQQQVTFTAEFSDECGKPDSSISVLDPRGEEVHSFGARGGGSEFEGPDIETFNWTTQPAAGTYYLRASGRLDYQACNYRINVGPANALAAEPPPLPRIPLAEPDNVPEQAHRNILPNVLYTGTLDSLDDREWLAFRIRPLQMLRIQLTGIGGGRQADGFGDCSRLTASYRKDPRSPDRPLGVSSDNDQHAEAYFKTGTGGLRYLEIHGGFLPDGGAPGCRWQLSLSPASALQPTLTRYSTGVSLRRRGRRHSGRLLSRGPGCTSGRLVRLRRVGSRRKGFGTARTDASGRYTIVRRTRLRGKLYVTVARREIGTSDCRSGRSNYVGRRIKKRRR